MNLLHPTRVSANAPSGVSRFMEAFVLENLMKAKKDLTGQRYGKLVALKRSERDPFKWVCACDCGNRTESNLYTLIAGTSTSCGCTRKTLEFRQNAAERATKHGLYGTVEYAAWGSLIDRCENPQSKDWENYGGRGIAVDPMWRHNPEAFIRDMGKRPGKGFSVERKDVNGPYSPANCVWDTAENQANNLRTNVNLTYGGKTQTVARWARELGIASTTLHDRLKTRSVEDAINFKAVARGLQVTYRGETMNVAQWAERLGFSRKGLAKRLLNHSVEDSFNTPKRT